MRWAAPEYAWWLLLVAAASVLLLQARRRQLRDLGRLAGVAAEAPGYAGLMLHLLVLCLLVAALCRPQWGTAEQRQESRGLDILVALDVSRSMQANDVQPSRLALARQAIAKLLPRLQGDRIGLIAFAGSAFLTCPLTSDYGAFSALLAATGPTTLPLGGTNLAAALTVAGDAFAGSGDRLKVLILVSDGEDHGGDTLAAARALRGTTVRVIAAGTREGGLIPVGDGGFLKDRRGAVVNSRMHPDRLDAIADAAKGRRLGLTPQILAELYDQDLAHLERRALASQNRGLAERFQIPLAIALAVMLLSGWRQAT